MATEWAEDDDFYGAPCEMDDQVLIDDDNDDDSELVDDDQYDREFSAKEAEYSFGDMSDDELQNTLKYQKLLSSLRKDQENDAMYPPERKPPIFDFFTVLTAFIAAVILAYYTISSY